MKSQFLLLILAVAVFSSCSTSYKSGQTPDDVYYSPSKTAEEYVEVKKTGNDNYRGYESDNAEDRWLHMRVRDPYRWNTFDDYDWNMHNSWTNNYYSPYSSSWNVYWNGYYSWNSFYNPYCRNVIIVNPKAYPSVYTKVRNFSLNSYTNNQYLNTNINRNSKVATRIPNSGYGSYGNSNSGSSLGNSIRKVFSGNSGGSNTNTYSTSGDRSSRSYSGGSSSGSSSSGGGSGSSSSGHSSGGGGGGGRRGG